MNKYRFISLILTALITLSATSCTFKAFTQLLPKSDSESSAEESSEDDEDDSEDNNKNDKSDDDKDKSDDKKNDDESETDDDEENNSLIDLNTIKEHIIQLENDAEIPDNADKINEDINILLNDLDVAMDQISNITLEHYSDWDNTELEAAYDSCYEDFYVAYELMSYVFANCYTIEEYSSIFEPYINEEYFEYYTDKAMTMTRLEGYTRVDYDVMDEYLDRYFEIAYDEDMDDDTKNLKAAEVYLELLATYDIETFYDMYDRDFSPEQIIELSHVIQEELLPISYELASVFIDMPEYDEVYDNPVVFDNPFDMLGEYAGKISPEIGESAELINSEKLYIMNEGDGCYNGSFTITFPAENYAKIYTYNYGDSYDFLTAVHEFGHFHASYFDDTNAYHAMNNIDIAEIQSQGMEMLYMPYYDDIFGNQGDEMRIFKLYDNLDSVLSGFLIGEFEYYVLQNLDTMTPEDVVDYFDYLMQDYNPDMEFHYISHIFEQPGYYISYGVSALAAFDIWQESVNDYDKAIEMYNNIAHVKANSGEYQFKSALQHCGFDDVLDEEYIKNLSYDILEYAYSIE